MDYTPRVRKPGGATPQPGLVIEPGQENDREGLDAAAWVREKLGFEPDGAQERVLVSGSVRGILNCTRQWGKSTIAAAKAVHQAYTGEESLTLVASPSGRQSAELVRKAEEFAKRLGIRTKGDGQNEISLEFANGARIVGLPENETTIRGFSSVALLLIDEASRVSDDVYRAIRPMLAVSEGGLWLMSTPCGKRGFFYEAWEHGGREWTRVRVTAEECPRISRAYLEEERNVLGDLWFRQEYLCEFVDSVNGIFDRDLIEAAMRDEVKPLVIR
ncbi:MAG: terminase family protein [Acidobacteriia bacterium]|nr:terminase family protein [Terriglobia bacterium]